MKILWNFNSIVWEGVETEQDCEHLKHTNSIGGFPTQVKKIIIFSLNTHGICSFSFSQPLQLLRLLPFLFLFCFPHGDDDVGGGGEHGGMIMMMTIHIRKSSYFRQEE